MKLEQFGQKICDALKETMGAEYETIFREVVKNNGVCLHSIVIAGKGSNISPAVYIDELYEEYEAGRAFGDIIYDILRIYQRHAKGINAHMDMEFFTQFERVKDRILYKLIHRDSNRKLLEDVPHFDWNDLALVFYYAFEGGRLSNATILIRNSHLTMWKQDVNAIYENARSNMLRLRPEELMPIQQIIREVMAQEGSKGAGQELELPTGCEAAMEGDSLMYVLSNRQRMFGAATLLYARSVRELADKLNKNLIILPSSVHEVLLVPDDGVTEKEFFKEMVKDVNDTQVEPEERLSYNVYHYDRVSGKISIL